jgi:deoxyuridine 5'-triphosphate nucleotidohydrolase
MKIKLTSSTAIPPKRAYPNDAGADIFADETVTIPSRESRAISTGISVAVDDRFYVRVAPRSGLALRHSIDVLAGVVDSKYRGEVKVILINHSKEDYTVQKGDRIAQLVVTHINTDPIEVVQNLDETDRGSDGFGSTDKVSKQSLFN